jgi:WD40 repeat protein
MRHDVDRLLYRLMVLGYFVLGVTAVAIPDEDPAEPLPPRALLRIGTPNLRVRYSFASALAFSPDGQFIAAAEINAPAPRISLFRVRTGRLVKRIIPPDLPEGSAQCVAFSPDGTRIAWGEFGGEVALWDLGRDALLFREKLHASRVSDVAFSPDGQLLASSGDDSVVFLVRPSAAPGEMIRRVEIGEGRPARAAFAGARMGQTAGPLGLAFTPDGAQLVAGAGSSETITVFRTEDGKLLRRIEGRVANSSKPSPTSGFVAVTPDGRQIIAVGQSIVPIGQTKLKYGAKNVNLSGIRLWDLRTGEHGPEWKGADGHGFGYAALSRDGRRLAVADFSELRILDVNTGQPQRTIPLPGCWGARPVFSPDGTIVAMPIANSVGLFEVETGRRLLHNERTPEGEFASCAWTPLGDRIATGHADGVVRVWEAATGKLVWHRTLAPVISPSGYGARPAFLAFSGDGRLLIAAGLRDDPVNYRHGIVVTYDAATGAVQREVEQQQIRWGALSPDGALAVVATSNGAWDDAHLIGIEVPTGRTRWNNPPPQQMAGFVQFAGMHALPDGSSFEVATRDAEIIKFDARNGREEGRFVAELQPPDARKAAGRVRGQTISAGFSADGGTVVMSTGEWLSVWNVETGTLRRKIASPSPHGCYLSLSPDGKTIATSEILYPGDPGEDTIRLFDTTSGECTLELEPKDDRAWVLSFSPDGTRLFTGFHRSTAIVWDVHRNRETQVRRP